ncbi:serine/threonine protein phosphatase [Streptomyces agglomeratus]|uniref:Serine/threonine protein phosphatase n=1 Tax=Streptomyces agglomeratus TaxID=285458 RepID=A0A1E5PK09_9ACTN|nr:PP2C family protein-serine/threonine phosphatase [Streptomyces agglomeratus]OEJ29893.1 serine/threonine protein phosphatase [Streptomyces agglomeratus]OEJ42092.1 serine/threonine protein phosphatase [Streptomyces agglomeratus]OEJ49396.1 serine/threonine protein phosphatase [Streptomyces agglomeratus]OEJ55399.1 serine/threonine protein phosphatase [Streptomyces agglomeratus]OEJ62773.1 serine/threonine protein phosphatase [Streptomyces agglomeratus]
MGLAGALAAAEAAAPVESLDVVARMLRQRLAATMVSFLITDFTGASVVRLGAAGSVETDEPARRIGLPGTLYDEVIRTQRLASEVRDDGRTVRVIAPVTNRGDAIGLLELVLPVAPDAAATREISETAHALAYIVIANRSFTDVYQWGRRTTPLSLAAEIQHRLLPASLACEAAQFTVAGALEPADHVGGDTFDYVIDRDTVQLSVTDAMGHDVDAALLATLAVGALRRARRAGADLAEQARQAHQAMLDHGRQSYVTGQLLRISLLDGSSEFINAGHPWPLRLREGRVEELSVEVDMPFGFQFPHSYRVQRLDLRRGDRLVMLTDGMLEHSASGMDLKGMIEHTSDLHPREAARTLIAKVIASNEGHLQDDATIMCLDWHGVAGHSRMHAATGADLAGASPPPTPPV